MKVIGNVRYIPVGTTQYVVDGSDGEINVDTSLSAITIILPNIVNSGFVNTDKGFIINDNSGNAATNNITIIAANNTVNSQSSVLISSNGGTAKCSIASMNEWFAVTEPSTNSGSSGLIQITYLGLLALKNTSSLTVGQKYVITDRFNYQSGGSTGIPNLSFLGDDRGLVYIQALQSNVLSQSVVRIMAVPESYSTTLNSQTSISVWNNSWKTANIGDLSIWGARVFEHITESIGSNVNQLNLDSNWRLRGKEAFPSDYTDVQFAAKYDFDNDWFEEQSDEKGNVFGVVFDRNTFNFNPVDISDWNMQTSSANTVFRNNRNIGVTNNSNSDPAIGGYSLASIYNNSNTGFIYENFGIFTLIFNNINSGNIRGNSTNGTGAYCSIDNNSNRGNISHNIITTGISRNSNSGNISNNELSVGIIDCVNDETLTDIVSIINSTGGIYNNILFNNFPTSTPYKYYYVDITGSTDLFFLGITTMDSENSVLLLYSTNATETIKTLSNFPSTKKSKIYIQTGLVVTFAHGLAVDNPRCKGGVNLVLNGDNGDWVEFQQIGSGIFETNAGKY